jgi:hypothetical protein
MSEKIVPVSLNPETNSGTHPQPRQIACQIRSQDFTVQIYGGIQQRVLETILKAVWSHD